MPSRSVLVTFMFISLSSAYSQYDQLLNIADSLWVRYQVEKSSATKSLILGKLSTLLHPYFPDSSFLLGVKGLTMARAANYDEGAAANNLSIGLYFWSIGKYSKAMDHVRKGLEWYESTNNKLGIARGYSLLANIYIGLNDKIKGLEYYQKAYALYKNEYRSDEIDGEVRSLTTIALTYARMERYDTSIVLINRAMNLSKSRAHFRSLDVSYILWSLGSIYLKKGEPEIAYTYFVNSIAENGPPEYKALTALNYLDMSKALWQMKKNDEALNLGHRALSIAKENGLLPNIRAITTELSSFYLQKNNIDEAFRYKNISEQAKDSLYSIQTVTEIKALEYALMAEKKDAEVHALQQQNKLNRIIFFLLGLLMVLGVGVAMIVVRKQREISRIKVLEAEMKNKNIQAELEIKALSESKIKAELDLRNQELTSQALKLVQKTELMDLVHLEIRKIMTVTSQESQSQLTELANKLKTSHRLDKDWENFKTYFDQVHKDFFNNLYLNYPSLGVRDIKLCALLKLNLDTKQIATILEVAPESVKMARHRVRKKLGLSSDENLPLFLNRLDVSNFYQGVSNKNN